MRNWTNLYRKLCKVLEKEFKWDKNCYIGASGNYKKCKDCSDIAIRIGIDPPCIDHG